MCVITCFGPNILFSPYILPAIPSDARITELGTSNSTKREPSVCLSHAPASGGFVTLVTPFKLLSTTFPDCFVALYSDLLIHLPTLVNGIGFGLNATSAKNPAEPASAPKKPSGANIPINRFS